MTVDPSAVTAALTGAAEPSAQPNETIGKYRLERQLGAGGMGVVWAAFDPDLERAVALKLLRVEATEEASMRTRLLREARAMARLRHPNVVTVFDVGTDRGRDYIAMELVEGGTLDEWLRTKPEQSAVIEALIAAGRGLHAAHLAGLVHRDFKPHNVLRDGSGHIFVTDFGLARGQIEEDGPELVPVALPVTEIASGSQPRRKRDLILDSPLTQTGVLIGTPAYMAPEQFTGATPDPKSDQFAFCVTAWQALTGERPFRGESLTQIEAAAREGAANLQAELSPALRAVLVRGLDPSPAARWPDIAALLEALADAARSPKPKRRLLVPLVAGGVLLGGGIVVFALSQRSQASADICSSPAKAFESAWTTQLRDKISNNVGATVVMDETRRQWIRSATVACTGERTAEKQKTIDCLVRVRDRLRTTLESASNGGNANIGFLATALLECDASGVMNGWRNKFQEFDTDDEPDVPEPPDVEPPEPPVAPARP